VLGSGVRGRLEVVLRLGCKMDSLKHLQDREEFVRSAKFLKLWYRRIDFGLRVSVASTMMDIKERGRLLSCQLNLAYLETLRNLSRYHFGLLLQTTADPVEGCAARKVLSLVLRVAYSPNLFLPRLDSPWSAELQIMRTSLSIAEHNQKRG
jgi:hypothetical protein